MNVQANLTIAARSPLTGESWSIGDVLQLFPRLGERMLQRARSLSGGEQQILACGRALVSSPLLMLIDEPSEGLAPLFVRELGRTIARLKEQGTAVLLEEQNLPFALALADYAYVMSEGRIVQEGTPEELEHNREVQSRLLGIGVAPTPQAAPSSRAGFRVVAW